MFVLDDTVRAIAAYHRRAVSIYLFRRLLVLAAFHFRSMLSIVFTVVVPHSCAQTIIYCAKKAVRFYCAHRRHVYVFCSITKKESRVLLS